MKRKFWQHHISNLFLVLIKIAIITTPFSIAHSELLYEFDFESGNFDGLSHDNAGTGNDPSITTSIVRDGNYAMKSYLNRLTSAYSYRTEVSHGYRATHHEDHWYGFSIYLPESYEHSNTWELLAQWHGYPDFSLGENWRSPPLALEVGYGQWRIANRIDARQVTSGGYQQDITIDISPIEDDKGRWVDWVFHVKWSWESDGILQIWKDGELVIDRKGPNTFNDIIGPYFKMGVYLGWKDRNCCSDGPYEKTVYHDELRIARGADAKYEDVAPAGEPRVNKSSPPNPPNLSIN